MFQVCYSCRPLLPPRSIISSVTSTGNWCVPLPQSANSVLSNESAINLSRLSINLIETLYINRRSSVRKKKLRHSVIRNKISNYSRPSRKSKICSICMFALQRRKESGIAEDTSIRSLNSLFLFHRHIHIRFTQCGTYSSLHDKVESGLNVKTSRHIRRNCILSILFLVFLLSSSRGMLEQIISLKWTLRNEMRITHCD